VHDIIDYSNNNKKVDSFNLKNEKLNTIEIILFCNCILETLLISKGKEKSIQTELNIDDILYHEDFCVNSDNFRIKQILLNFISNSVKFLKSGFIKIKTIVKFLDLNYLKIDKAYCKNSLDDPNHKSNKKSENNRKLPYLIISVEDSGMGMNENELKNVFEEDKNFIKKDYNLEGSGLGLSIAKYLAEALGHSVKVKSILGKGSEFSLILNCNFPKIFDKEKIKSFNSHRQLKCSLFKNEIIFEENKVLNKSCGNFLNYLLFNKKTMQK